MYTAELLGSAAQVQRLHVPILLEEIEQRRCTVKKLAGKIVLTLAKRDTSKSWCVQLLPSNATPRGRRRLHRVHHLGVRGPGRGQVRAA